MKAWLLVFVMLAACATAPPPVPPRVEQAPQPPGYLGFGFTYHKPDAANGTGGWLMVRHVPDDGPAHRAGLKPQDVITAIDGRALDFADDGGILNILEALRPGDVIRLTLGGHEAREVTLVAADMPPDKLRIWEANFEPPPKP